MLQAPTKPTRKDAVLLLLLAAITFALFLPGFQGHLLAVRDMPGITLPSRAFWRNAVLAHELPVWNPLVAIGIPTLAVPIHGAFYPGHLLLLVGSLAQGVALTWAVHLWLASAGGYTLARTVGCRPETAFIAAAIFGFGGFAFSTIWTGEKTLPQAWVPWMAWTVQRAAALPSGRRIALAAFPPALICAAGDPFILFDAFILTVPFAVAAIPESRPRKQALRDLAVALIAPLAIAGFLVAPILIPAALLRSETTRAGGLAISQAELWSLHPSRWPELFLSRPLGEPENAWSDVDGSGMDVATIVEFWSVTLYVGAATCALATAARGRLAKWLLGATVLAILVALGRHLPVHGWVRILLPPFAYSRFPEKHVVVASDALAIFAALGTERLLSDKSVRTQHLAFVFGFATAGIAASALLGHLWTGLPIIHGVTQAAVIVALMAVAVLLGRRLPGLVALPAVVLGIDLLWADVPLLSWVETPGLPRSAWADTILEGRTNIPPRIFYAPRFDPRSFTRFPLNAPSLYGIDAIPGEDSAYTPEMDALAALMVATGVPMWERLRISHHIDRIPHPPPGTPLDQRWTVVKEPQQPRAWMVGRIEVADGIGAVDHVGSRNFDLESEATVGSDAVTPELAPLINAPAKNGGACTVEHYGYTHVDLVCEAAAPSLAVLADGYSEGWGVAIDGTPSAMVRADGIYRGAFVPAGAHHVRFDYDAPGLVFGALIALLGALIAALLSLRVEPFATAAAAAKEEGTA